CADARDEARRHGGVDVVIYGHTHQVVVERPQGEDTLPLVLNPGECGGWLTGDPTVALLDTDTLEVEVVSLKDR
ncbi:MAG: metallophosphoesterase family protein, partial [Candidatus Glassbacteria bacterium]|nr:metallophosphoesterase family protein [Candidatus Glassbacteria bacterium]